MHLHTHTNICNSSPPHPPNKIIIQCFQFFREEIDYWILRNLSRCISSKLRSISFLYLSFPPSFFNILCFKSFKSYTRRYFYPVKTANFLPEFKIFIMSYFSLLNSWLSFINAVLHVGAILQSKPNFKVLYLQGL